MNVTSKNNLISIPHLGVFLASLKIAHKWGGHEGVKRTRKNGVDRIIFMRGGKEPMKREMKGVLWVTTWKRFRTT